MTRRLGLLLCLYAATLCAAPAARAQQKQTVTIWSWFIASTVEKSVRALEATDPNIVVKYTYYNYSPNT